MLLDPHTFSGPAFSAAFNRRKHLEVADDFSFEESQRQSLQLSKEYSAQEFFAD
jgi:hypothetical protein